MARINNKNKYTQKEPVLGEDFLIGSSNLTGKTHTFSISSIVALALGNGGVDTFATLNGNTLTLADGQTYDLTHTVDTDTDTFATISGGVITFSDGSIFDLSSVDTDTFATLSGNILTLPNGDTIDVTPVVDTDTDTFATLSGTTITFANGDTIVVPTSSGSEYTNTDNTGGRFRKFIIPVNFDFQNIPIGYEDAVWEIRFVHDLGGLDVTIPDNVTLYFNNGKLTNYGNIDNENVFIDWSANYQIFDGSGEFSHNGKTVKGFITPTHFGAVGDNLTDSTTAFNKTAQFVGSQRVNFIANGQPSFTFPKDLSSTEVRVLSGMYIITDSIVLRAGQVWVGNRNNVILLFQPQLKTLTSSLTDYVKVKNGEATFDTIVGTTYPTISDMLTDQVNQVNKGLQTVTDARTADEILNGDPAYSTQYILNLNKDLIVLNGDTNPDFNYDFYVMQNVRFKGFTLSGDVRYDGTGNAGNAIYLNNASQNLFEDIYISKFERGVDVNIGDVARAAYYNKFKNVHIQYVKQAANMGVGTAVTDFEDCILISRAETVDRYRHLIENYNNTTFRNCSFEGGTPTTEAIYSPIGKVIVIGGRDETNTLMKFSGRGVTGGVTVILPNGVTGGFGSVIDIDDAPLEADMNTDQNVLGQNINMGQGVAQEVTLLKNQSLKFGMTDWLFDGNGTEGEYQIMTGREDRMGSPQSIKMTKNAGGGYAFRQSFDANSPQIYGTVWVKKSLDAVERIHLGALFPRDNAADNNFKSFIPMLHMGEWTLYVVKLSHYYKTEPNSKPTVYLGLTNNSPEDSWIIFSNLRFFVGGYTLFSGSDTDEVNKIFSSSKLPSEGLLKLGDKVYYDGSDVSYPVTATGAKGVVCVYNLDTVTTTTKVATATTIDITSSAGVNQDDYIGVWQDDGSMLWSTVSNITGNEITLNDALTAGVEIGSRVYIYRVSDFGQIADALPNNLMSFKGYWNPNTDTNLSDADTDALGDVWRVSEAGTANLMLGIGSDIFNTGQAQGTGNATASYVLGGVNFTSDGTGSTILPRSRWTNLNEGSKYEIQITGITLNSGTQPDFSLFDGTSYIRNNVAMVQETIEFIAGSGAIFFAVDGAGTFDLTVDVTLREIVSDALNTFKKGDVICNDGENYFKLSQA